MTETENEEVFRWSIPGVPHKGWYWVGTEDLEEPSHTCEMCRTAVVRYVHYMRNPDYHEDLAVGCICAEHMAEDRVNPKRREQAAKNRSIRRKKWITRTWRESYNGNAFLNADGHHVVLFSRKEFWKFLADGYSDDKMYRTQGEAALGAFDFLYPKQVRNAHAD